MKVKQWKELPVPEVGDDYDGHFRAIRLNSLGSLYYFGKHVVGYSRFTTLHKQICKSLEIDKLFLVMELPMSHFKTRAGIALSMWWSLPFGDRDEEYMRKLGYGDAWIRWMRAAHEQNRRTLITHEISDQAAAIGKDVDATYTHNDLFRECFREILPDRNCTWNNHAKYQKRLRGADATTGTYVYRGVGQALQGIHVDGILQDDNVGKEAQTNLLKGDGRVMQDVIRWHQQLGTRFDPAVGKARRQLVIGNRWSHADLNAYIKKKQPEFSFESHSAEGGCCKLHPSGKPILPSEWTMELLAKERDRLGVYDYSHFYLNIGTLPEEQVFNKSWLRMFKYKEARPDLPKTDLRNVLLIEHNVYDGKVVDDCQPGALDIIILVDANHAKKVERNRHVIWSIGRDPESARIYLLSLWEKQSTYSDLIEEMYKLYSRWTKTNPVIPPMVYMGKVAHQLLSFYLSERDRRETVHLTIEEFDDDDSLAAMKNRIESLEPTLKNNQFWCHPSQKDFIEAVENYPATDLDSLDVLGYLPTVMDISSSKDDEDFLARQQASFANRNA